VPLNGSPIFAFPFSINHLSTLVIAVVWNARMDLRSLQSSSALSQSFFSFSQKIEPFCKCAAKSGWSLSNFSMMWPFNLPLISLADRAGHARTACAS
jgi:hypothetical protein